MLRPLLSFFSSFTLCCFFALSAPSAQAEETGNHYDPERVMGQSALFTQLNKTQLKLVGPLESAMKRMDGALADLDLNVGLTGEAVDVAARELWAARLEQRAGEFSTFFDAFQDRFSEDGAAYQVIFLGALDRAVQSLKDETGVDVSECASNKNPFGMAGPGGMAAKTCQGEDLSARIAGMWDQDPELKAALVELGKKAWPTLASYETDTEVALVRGGGAAPDGWIAPSQLVKLVPEASELLFTIEVRTEDGRRALLEERAALSGSPEEAEGKLASIRERAKALREYAEDAKAALGAALWESQVRSVKKTKTLKKKSIGVCLNPQDWGSCVGENLTSEVGESLLKDRKLQKTMKRLLDDLGAPPI